jgi:hypothetical protein
MKNKHPDSLLTHFFPLALAGAFAAGTLTLSSNAHASTPLSVDINYAEPIAQDNTNSGLGGQLRFGPRLDLKILTLDSEIVAGAHFFDGAASPNVYQGMLGPRLGILWGLRPSVFGHLGVGHVAFPELQDRTNLAGDLGVALDLTFLPVIDIGAHGTWNFVAGNNDWDGMQFVTIGAHITFLAKD